MPRFYKQNLLSSPLETPEIPAHLPQHQDFDRDEEDPIRVLLTWKAPSRPFRKKDRSFYTTVAILVFLLAMISLLAEQILLIGALLALAFLVYVLNFIPPEEVEYKLSTQGVTIGDHFYHWQELNSFWFSEKEGYKLLNIYTNLRFPGVLILVLGNTDTEDIKRVCARYLPFHEIAPKTMMDKWAESLQRHFPLENPHR